MKDNSPLMKMSVKVLKYILIGMNEFVGVDSPTKSINQETLMYSHDCKQWNLPLMYANSKVLYIALISFPDKVLRSMGQDLLEGGP